MRKRWLTGMTAALAVVVAPLYVPAVAAAPASAPTMSVTVTDTPAGPLRSEVLRLDGGRARSAPVGPGWSTEVAVAPGTQMAGLTWTGSSDVELEVRSRTGAGPWSDWLDLHADLPDGEGSRLGVGPVWMGSAGVDTVAVRVLHGTPTDLRLMAMSVPAGGRGSSRAALDTAATPAGGPPIHTRADWAPGGWQGWRSGCTPVPAVMSRLRFAVVHHTVSSNSYAARDVPALLAGIYRFHTEGNGWCDIAYNFFVDRFGGVWQGRSGDIHAPVMGGHAKGFNTDSVGVALLGQHQPGASPAAVAPSAAALRSVRDLLAWKFASNDINPWAIIPIVSRGSPRYAAGRTVNLPTIQGHRDSGLTSCPGDLTYGQLRRLRDDVGARMAATAVPNQWVPARSGPAFFNRLRDQAAGKDIPVGVAGRDTSTVLRAGRSRDQLAHDIVYAGGTDVRVGTIDRLYQAAFGRIPDAPGLAFWIGQRDRGSSNSWFARAFAETPEFRQRYDDLDDVAYVEALYTNVLGRLPDRAGQQYWVGRLASGTSRPQVLAHFSESPENRARSRVRTDVTRAWFTMLQRAPSAFDHEYWRQRFASGQTTLHLVRTLLHSAEYARRA